jgi:uncharacterized protein (TIGR03437 family)
MGAMPSARSFLALVPVWCCMFGAEKPVPRVAPYYDAASIVNAADNQSGQLAANTIGTIYGTALAYGTAAISLNDIRNGLLPTVLGDDETQVFIGGYAADLYYVSPTQINFLVPPNMQAAPVSIYVTVDSLRGAIVPLTLGAAAPGLFQLPPGTCPLPAVSIPQCAIATLPDGTVLTPSLPAQPGEVVTLWATGLGQTDPMPVYGQLPTAAAPLVQGAKLSILLDGKPVPPAAVSYAGIAPGFAGLYQINFQLPMSTGANPEIRVQVDGPMSASKVYLPVMLN